MSESQQKSKIIEFQILNQQVPQLHEQIQVINNNIQELQILKNSLEELESVRKDQEILIPLGQGIFTKGNIINPDELITNVGSNILIEKNLKDTKDTIKINILNLSKALERTEEEISRNIEKLQGLQKEIIEKDKQ